MEIISLLFDLLWLLLTVVTVILGIAFAILLVILLILKFAAKVKCKAGWIILLCNAVAIGIVIVLSVVAFIAGILTNPVTWCKHEYSVIEEVAPTCTQKGKTVKHCPLCNDTIYEHPAKIAHQWFEGETVDATCTEGGYTVERCSGCSNTRKTNETEVLGHSMKEFSLIEPAYQVEGEVVFKCERCSHKETEKIPPLTYVKGVDYEEIYREYDLNKLRAEATYKGNRYRVTATINGMATGGLMNSTGGATLTMVIKIDNTYVFFLAEFEKEQEEALKTINVGDTITFEGECSSDELWINCELIK